MKFTVAALLAAFSLLAPPVALQAQQDDMPVFTPERVEATVRFLSDDLLEGRDTGSTGHEIAARYVASRFAELGLKPAGDEGSYFQRVTLQQTDPAANPGSITVSGPGGTVRSWKHATDVLVGVSANEPHLDVSAPLVFVGYGIENSRLGINDYAGLDVKGKIVVALRGFPKGLPSEAAAHLAATKARAADKHGAIAIMSVGTILSMKTRPWQRMVNFADEPSFAWVRADGKTFDEAPNIRVTAALNEPAAQAVFAGARRTLEAIRAVAEKPGGRPKGFALETRVRIQSESITKRVTSPNVVAILPGSDAKLGQEYVVLSAHLDHIGVRPATAEDKPGTDRINNGALDNAAGVATMLEVARASAAAPDRPRRSLIFIATTGEEKGLLGADYYARHPSVPIKAIVGNVDLDMPVLLYRFTDLTAFGAEHSTLGPIVAKAVAPMGIGLSPDPMPQESIFVRSDHYMFVKQGVPAVFLATGFANGGEEHWGHFLGGAYHHSDDDINQKIDWESGARFAEANYRVIRAIADADTPPLWYEKDFFGDSFAPNAPKAPRP